jgi:hypothetical protein
VLENVRGLVALVGIASLFALIGYGIWHDCYRDPR